MKQKATEQEKHVNLALAAMTTVRNELYAAFQMPDDDVKKGRLMMLHQSACDLQFYIRALSSSAIEEMYREELKLPNSN